MSLVVNELQIETDELFSGVAVVSHRVLQQVLYIFAPTQSQFIKLSHLQFNRPSLAFAFRLYKTIARHDTFFFWIESSPGFLGLSSTKIFFKLDRATVFFKAPCRLGKIKERE